MIRAASVALFLMIASGAAVAQTTPASLVADRVFVEPDGRITATGNVEVYQDGVRLTANRVVYDRNTDQLTVEGPITVADDSGSVFAADEASISPDLRTGMLQSARLVLDQQLQLAAVEIGRLNDRYSTLDRVVASSCQICEQSETPLWEIRARRVIQDTEEKQLYFEGAQFRLAGVPLFYSPRLRIPDPSVDRAAGVLIPALSTSSSLGTGVKLPYFLPIGDHADTTLTPYISSVTRTLELEFRQELKIGDISAIGAISNDDLEGTRGYLFGRGTFYLPRDFIADVNIELVSDPGYLFVYDYSDKDRLQNSLEFSRVRRKDLLRASFTEFRTLRDDEIDNRDELPDRYLEATYQRYFPSLSFGGRTLGRIDASALNRPSSEDVFGRDVSRIGVGLEWERSEVFGPGIVAKAELGFRVDAYNTGQDSNFTTNVTRRAPRGAVELRWPTSRAIGQVTEVLEPIARIDIGDVSGEAVPNEDSRVVEFDEANLFYHTRYPGLDRLEEGVRLALGASWRRQSTDGWKTDVTFGRVANLTESLGYPEGTGLEGDTSDWLVAGRFALGRDFWAATRALFDDSLTFTLSETRLDWSFENGTLTTSYILAAPEPTENREDKLSEWSFEGSVGIDENWTASADFRYDFNAGTPARTGLGLDYRNECIAIDLSVSRRFATSSSVTPTTDFGFRVSLLGIGNGGNASGASRTCRG